MDFENEQESDSRKHEAKFETVGKFVKKRSVKCQSVKVSNKKVESKLLQSLWLYVHTH